MSSAASREGDGAVSSARPFWQQEDWWSVWIGLGGVLIAGLLVSMHDGIDWIAVTPPRWSVPSELLVHFTAAGWRYAVQFATLLGLCTTATAAMGYRPVDFIPGFALLYVLSLGVLCLGTWEAAQYYNIEAPLIAVIAGLLISHVVRVPPRMHAAFRVEFYIKTGVVLMGGMLPFPLIAWAGPVAFAQASIASIVTFIVIYRVGLFLELDRRLAAILAAGGAVCGVSAVISVAGAVRARREHLPIAIATVVLWAIAMIIVLPLLAWAWHLPAGVAGAWIGTSEFADAAGFAAAQTYGAWARSGIVAGTEDQAITAYTLVKVVGRDVWIGIWAFIWAAIAVTKWDAAEFGGGIDASEIWSRSPKFVVGFLLASVFMTWLAYDVSLADYNTVLKPAVTGPLTVLRNWAFTFSFLSIGLSTRIFSFGASSGNAFLAFSVGVAVNLVLGYLLSAVVFESYWTALPN